MVNAFNNNSQSKMGEILEERKNNNPAKQFIEVEPALPTYHIFWGSLAKVVKFLFCPGGCNPDYYIIQHVGYACDMWMFDREEDVFFTTLPLHPNVAPDDGIATLFVHNDCDIEFTMKELSVWGIDQVYFDLSYEKTMDVRAFLEKTKDVATNSYSDVYEAIKDIFWRKSDDEKLKIFGF